MHPLSSFLTDRDTESRVMVLSHGVNGRMQAAPWLANTTARTAMKRSAETQITKDGREDDGEDDVGLFHSYMTLEFIHLADYATDRSSESTC